MKKLMAVMAGLAFALCTVGASFAQDQPKEPTKKESKKKSSKKKKAEKKEEEKK